MAGGVVTSEQALELRRAWGGEKEWAYEVRQVAGLARLLKPFKLDRRVLVTVPVWALTLGRKILESRALEHVCGDELALTWCSLPVSMRGDDLRTYERAAAVCSLLDLAHGLEAEEAVRKLLGVEKDLWDAVSPRDRGAWAALRRRWVAELRP